MFFKSNLAFCIAKGKKEGFFQWIIFQNYRMIYWQEKTIFFIKYSILIGQIRHIHTLLSIQMIALSNLHFSNFISFENWRFYCIGCAFLQYSCYRRSYLFVSLFLSYTDKTCDKIETKFALSDFMKKELTFDLQLNSSLMLSISLGINRWSWRIHCMKDESKSCLFYCCNGFKIFS